MDKARASKIHRCVIAVSIPAGTPTLTVTLREIENVAGKDCNVYYSIDIFLTLAAPICILHPTTFPSLVCISEQQQTVRGDPRCLTTPVYSRVHTCRILTIYADPRLIVLRGVQCSAARYVIRRRHFSESACCVGGSVTRRSTFHGRRTPTTRPEALVVVLCVFFVIQSPDWQIQNNQNDHKLNQFQPQEQCGTHIPTWSLDSQ